jgi:hypothetical protein
MNKLECSYVVELYFENIFDHGEVCFFFEMVGPQKCTIYCYISLLYTGTRCYVLWDAGTFCFCFV